MLQITIIAYWQQGISLILVLSYFCLELEMSSTYCILCFCLLQLSDYVKTHDCVFIWPLLPFCNVLLCQRAYYGQRIIRLVFFSFSLSGNNGECLYTKDSTVIVNSSAQISTSKGNVVMHGNLQNYYEPTEACW